MRVKEMFQPQHPHIICSYISTGFSVITKGVFYEKAKKKHTFCYIYIYQETWLSSPSWISFQKLLLDCYEILNSCRKQDYPLSDVTYFSVSTSNLLIWEF